MKKFNKYFVCALAILISFSVQAQPSAKSEITFLNKDSLFSIMDKSPNDYHLLYSYGNWCKECKETFPQLMDIISNYTNIDFYLLIVDKPNKDYFAQNIEVLREKFHYRGQLYAADFSYGKRYYHQYKNFITEIAPMHSEYGMSLIMLFTKTGEILYATTYHQSIDEKFDGLKKALENN